MIELMYAVEKHWEPRNTVTAPYTGIRYNDKTYYNNSLNGTNP